MKMPAAILMPCKGECGCFHNRYSIFFSSTLAPCIGVYLVVASFNLCVNSAILLWTLFGCVRRWMCRAKMTGAICVTYTGIICASDATFVKSVESEM
jgi:hypothetical protein